jgi:diguanylate cyclase (GGDEF)-like protein
MSICLTVADMADRFSELIFSDLGTQDFRSLLSPRHHISLLQLRRSRIIIGRVRLMACLFAVLTPLWIIVDYLFLPRSLWVILGALRVLTSLSFAYMAMYLRPEANSRNPYHALTMLFVIPGMFYILTQDILAHYRLDGISEAIKTGYAYLPFILLSGISIFPLTLLEALVIAFPLLLMQAISGLFSGPMLGWPSFAGAFWLLLLITCVNSLSCMSQLSFMIALFQQAIHDSLTGAFSRRSGEELLNLQIQIAIRNHSPLSVAFIDLDRFKEINDRFGHDAGDKALVTSAQKINQHLRHADILIRWGGEEFLLIMPGTNIEEARLALSRLHDHHYGERPDGTVLTASVGLAERDPEKDLDWKSLVDKADRGMYLAKQSGRNRIVPFNQ